MTIKTNALILICAVLLGTAPALAQDSGDYGFSGELRIGYRSVDFGGNGDKYREDLNYDDGPRLFDLRFDFAPEEGVGNLADRIFLDVNDYGGEPYETLSLGVQKFETFDFRYDRRKSDYFYSDLLSAGHPDFHTFDFERVRDTARLDVELTERAQLGFGFDRYTREGESTTTLDVSRDEFEMDRPIDESSSTYFANFSYAWEQVTLTLEERRRDFDNDVSLFLPGFSEGEAPGPASLDFFFLDQPYEYTADEHVARVVATPGRLTVRAQVLLQDLEMDVDASERSRGVAFNGNPLATDLTGSGAIERDLQLFDVDLTYLVSDRVAVIGGAYQRDFDQEGDFLFGGDLNRGAWDVETRGVEAGVEVVAATGVTLTGGVRWEERDVRSEAEGGGEDFLTDETTEHTGYFGTAAWRPSGTGFSLTATVDNSSFDDPFTLASPTDRLRVRLRAAYQLDNGFTLSGSYLDHEIENDNSGWDASYDQANLRLAYSRDGLDASLGYGLLEIDRDVDQTVVTLPGFGGGQQIPFAIVYSAEADTIDGRLRWQASEAWILGGSFYLYENDGSFALERDDLRLFVDYLFPQGTTVGVAYRTVDYDEADFAFDDYDADILEVSVGYRW